jgi:hypothetical protein
MMRALLGVFVVRFRLRACRFALPADVPDHGQSDPDQRHRTQKEDAVQNLHRERITNGEEGWRRETIAGEARLPVNWRFGVWAVRRHTAG